MATVAELKAFNLETKLNNLATDYYLNIEVVAQGSEIILTAEVNGHDFAEVFSEFDSASRIYTEALYVLYQFKKATSN